MNFFRNVYYFDMIIQRVENDIDCTLWLVSNTNLECHVTYLPISPQGTPQYEFSCNGN